MNTSTATQNFLKEYIKYQPCLLLAHRANVFVPIFQNSSLMAKNFFTKFSAEPTFFQILIYIKLLSPNSVNKPTGGAVTMMCEKIRKPRIVSCTHVCLGGVVGKGWWVNQFDLRLSYFMEN